jgi:nucleotide-binding universal stress UspA family protein
MPGAVERPVDHPLQAAAGRLKVLLATDGADESAAACRLLQNLSLPPGSALRILSIVDEPTVPGPGCPPFGIPWNTMEEDLEHDQGGAREAIRYAGALVSSTDFSVTARVREGNPVTEILREAEALDADLVVVGSRGLTGLRGLMHRSVARAVVERCQRPVLMARAPRNELREVIVALDGSVHARNAAEFFAWFPLPDAAWSTLLHVVRSAKALPGSPGIDQGEGPRDTSELRGDSLDLGGSLLTATAAKLSKRGKQVRTEVRTGNPATEILELAERRRADLIVAGARGVSLLEGLLVGSVAERLLREARCSVLIVH